MNDILKETLNENNQENKCINCEQFRQAYTKSEIGFKKEPLGYCYHFSRIIDIEGDSVCPYRKEKVRSDNANFGKARILKSLLFKLSEVCEQLWEMENEKRN